MTRFLWRLFRRQEKPKPAPLPVPSGSAQTEADQDAVRKYWEAEVAADRKRRGTPEKRRRSIRPGCTNAEMAPPAVSAYPAAIL